MFILIFAALVGCAVSASDTDTVAAIDGSNSERISALELRLDDAEIRLDDAEIRLDDAEIRLDVQAAQLMTAESRIDVLETAPVLHMEEGRCDDFATSVPEFRGLGPMLMWIADDNYPDRWGFVPLGATNDGHPAVTGCRGSVYRLLWWE